MMGVTSSEIQKQDRFLTWALAQGVTIDGVKIATIADRGLGIVAERKVEVGDISMHTDF